MRNNIGELKKHLDDRTRESEHLRGLVAQMEASATNDEVIRTQIQDLRTELENSEGEGANNTYCLVCDGGNSFKVRTSFQSW